MIKTKKKQKIREKTKKYKKDDKKQVTLLYSPESKNIEKIDFFVKNPQIVSQENLKKKLKQNNIYKNNYKKMKDNYENKRSEDCGNSLYYIIKFKPKYVRDKYKELTDKMNNLEKKIQTINIENRSITIKLEEIKNITINKTNKLYKKKK